MCTICNFVEEHMSTVLDPAARNAAVHMEQQDKSLSNRQAWLAAQKSCQGCREAHWCLSTGKKPSKKVGELHSNTRRYCRESTIAGDGLLVVKEKASAATGGVTRERIVVPQKLLDTVLYQLHNTELHHPAKTQLKVTFVRQFYAFELDKHLDELYANCYACSILQRLPKVQVQHETKTEVLHPHTVFHIDVIKRAKQNILLLVDNFSSFQTATLIESETAMAMKEGMVRLLEGVRRPGWVTVRADNAKGFESLAKKDDDIDQLKIKLELTDPLNKNSNAVVDKGCQELEEEMRKLSPEGKPLTQVLLARAVLAVNQKLRRGGKLSAYEINSARDSNTGENLVIKDEEIRIKQLDKRDMDNKKVVDVNSKHKQVIKVGDTVAVLGKQDKHMARDIFVVTEDMEDKVRAQKLLHPLTGKLKMMSKQYETDKKRLVVVRSGEAAARVRLGEKKEVKKVEQHYDPVNKNFWTNDEDSEDEETVSTEEHKVPARRQVQVQVRQEQQHQEELQEVQHQEQLPAQEEQPQHEDQQAQEEVLQDNEQMQEVQAHGEQVQEEQEQVVQVQETQVQGVRHRTEGTSAPGREVHRRPRVTNKVVVRPRTAADIPGRLVTEHEVIRYIVSRQGARNTVWQTATVVRMFRNLQMRSPTFYNVRTTAGVLCSKELLLEGGWQVWRRYKWWDPEDEDLPGPDLQEQQE